jgi:hypothetical protein
MVKNTGIFGNQLSDLDLGSVLKDSHNKLLHALDVNQVKTSQKTIVTYTDCGKISKVEYYGLGKQTLIDLTIPEYPLGKAEITTFPFLSQTPSSLSNKYVTIYDDIGSVGIIFRVDSGAITSTGLDRDLICDILSTDSLLNICQKFTSLMDSDSKFLATSLSSLSIVQSNTIGNKTNATGGTTTITPSISNGVDSLAGKYFQLYNYDNTYKDTWYFTIDDIGNEPTHDGETLTEISLTSDDTRITIGQKTASSISLNNYLTATSDSGRIDVIYNPNGKSNGFLDGNSTITSSVKQQGEDVTLVKTILITYNDDGTIANREEF